MFKEKRVDLIPNIKLIKRKEDVCVCKEKLEKKSK